MSFELSFWLLVVFGLVVYVVIIRANSTEPAVRRRPKAETFPDRRAASRERPATPRKPAAARTRPPVRRKKAPSTTGVRRAAPRGPFSWIFFDKR